MFVKICSSFLIVSLILLVVCLAGCKKKTNPPPSGAGKADGSLTKSNIIHKATFDNNVVSPDIAPNSVHQQILATVNGVNIYKDDFDKRVESQISPVQRQMPVNFFEQYKKELSKKVLDEMVVDILLVQKAKEKGIAVSEEEIDRRISEFLQKQKMTMQNFREMEKAKGEDFDQFRDKVRQNLIFEKLVVTEYGPIDTNDANDAQKKRMDLAGQYIQKLKSAAKITFTSP